MSLCRMNRALQLTEIYPPVQRPPRQIRVKRRDRMGSRFGLLATPHVQPMSLPLAFLHQILVPRRDDHQQIPRAVGDALAAQARLRRDRAGRVEHVFLVVGGRVAALPALRNT